MLKLLGAIIIVMGSSGLGFSLSQELIYRHRELKRLKRWMLYLHSQIRYQNTNLAVAFHDVAGKAEGLFGEFFEEVSKQMQRFEGDEFTVIWKKQVEERFAKSHMNKEDKEKLCSLGDTLGCLDKQMQLDTLDYYIEQLDLDIVQASENIKNNTKLYRSLGVMGGILITLIIV